MESAVQAVFVSDEYSVHATTNRSQSSHFRSSSSFLVVANEGHANLREKGARIWLSGSRSIIYSTSPLPSRAASRWVTCTFRDVVKKETRRGSNARKKRERTTRENERVNRLPSTMCSRCLSFPPLLSFPDSGLMG